jgi:hypothetical protein
MRRPPAGLLLAVPLRQKLQWLPGWLSTTWNIRPPLVKKWSIHDWTASKVALDPGTATGPAAMVPLATSEGGMGILVLAHGGRKERGSVCGGWGKGPWAPPAKQSRTVELHGVSVRTRSPSCCSRVCKPPHQAQVNCNAVHPPDVAQQPSLQVRVLHVHNQQSVAAGHVAARVHTFHSAFAAAAARGQYTRCDRCTSTHDDQGQDKHQTAPAADAAPVPDHVLAQASACGKQLQRKVVHGVRGAGMLGSIQVDQAPVLRLRHLLVSNCQL